MRELRWVDGEPVIDGQRFETKPRERETDKRHRERVEAREDVINGAIVLYKVVSREDVRVLVHQGGRETINPDWWKTDEEAAQEQTR